MNKIAILVRHGDYHQKDSTPSALQPYPLTDEGTQQALDCVSLIRKMVDDQGWQLSKKIHSSPLLRAWQTADIIKGGLSEISTHETFDALVERNVGSVANLTIAEINDLLEADPRYETAPENWKSNSHYRLPFVGAESLMDAGKRVAAHLKETLNSLPSDNENPIAQIFVAHGASIRHAAHILGVMDFDDIAKYSMFHAQPVALCLTDNNIWHQSAGDWKIRPAKETQMD